MSRALISRTQSSYMARRAGVPFGVARGVILRDLKFGLNWKPTNRLKNVSVIHKIWIRLARIPILIERRHISDSRRLRKPLSELNLRFFDGAMSDACYDIFVKFSPPLGLVGQNVETFGTLSSLAMALAAAEWSTMSRLRLGSNGSKSRGSLWGSS